MDLERECSVRVKPLLIGSSVIATKGSKRGVTAGGSG